MKRLTVTYDGLTLVDSDVAEFGWQDSEGQLMVNARWQAPKPVSSGNALGDLISSLSKQRTQAKIEELSEAESP